MIQLVHGFHEHGAVASRILFGLTGCAAADRKYLERRIRGAAKEGVKITSRGARELTIFKWPGMTIELSRSFSPATARVAVPPPTPTLLARVCPSKRIALVLV